MPSDNTRVEDREDLGEAIRAAFARPTGEQAFVPIGGTQIAVADAIITAQKVAVERDEGKVLGKIRTLAHAVGDEFFYRFPVKDRKTGKTNWIEGPSIKCANNVARLYGNCQVDTRVVDNGDSWIIYGRFVDYETGFSYTRPFQQRKNQGSIGGDADRQRDIALQIGVSKTIRNVICNALETFTNYAFEEAKSAIVGRVGKNLDAYRDRVMGRLTEIQVDLHRVEFTVGRASKDWLAPDVARIITQLQAINDGMATVDETWPPQAGQEKTAEARPTREQFTEAKTEEPFAVTDFAGNEVEIAGAGAAADAYRAILDVAEKQGEAALGTAIDNNGVFFTQLDERGHADLSRELSLEGGRRREAARNAPVPRGTDGPKTADTTNDTETRGNDAAARPDGASDAPTSDHPRQADPSPTGRESAPVTASPAGTTSPQPQQTVERTAVSADQSAGPLNHAQTPPAGDLLTTPQPRDIKFWGRKDGSRKLLATEPDGFLGELPQRLHECDSWEDTKDIERDNAAMIRKLSADDRMEVSGLFTRRREELRGA